MTRFASTGAFIGLTLSLLFLSTAQSAKVEKYELKYYEEFVRFTKNFDSKGRIVNFYFYGEKNITVCQRVLRKKSNVLTNICFTLFREIHSVPIAMQQSLKSRKLSIIMAITQCLCLWTLATSKNFSAWKSIANFITFFQRHVERQEQFIQNR